MQYESRHLTISVSRAVIPSEGRIALHLFPHLPALHTMELHVAAPQQLTAKDRSWEVEGQRIIVVAGAGLGSNSQSQRWAAP